MLHFCGMNFKYRLKKQNKNNYLTILTCVAIVFMACHRNSPSTNSANLVQQPQGVKRLHLHSKADQDALTPDMVLQDLIDGNKRFNNDTITFRFHSESVRKAVTGGQFPKAMVLSCVDSRVPVEDVFDQGLGDVFVGRVAGNFVNSDLLGSMEFACKVSGAKLIVVMGHQHCGAIKGAIDDVHLGNLTQMLTNIKPAVVRSADFIGEKSSNNDTYVRYVAENNIRNTVKNIREKSPILRQLELEGKIKIVGVFYVLRTGKIEFIQ